MTELFVVFPRSKESGPLDSKTKLLMPLAEQLGAHTMSPIYRERFDATPINHARHGIEQIDNRQSLVLAFPGSLPR